MTRSRSIELLCARHGLMWLAGCRAASERVAPQGPVQVYASIDRGETWRAAAAGLPAEVSISDLAASAATLVLAFGDAALQVNGLAVEGRGLYVGTQRGAYRFDPDAGWTLVLPDRALHNIAIANGRVYAMAYNELYVSTDRGGTWQSAQAAMPAGKYTFQVQAAGDAVLAGQWDSVYRMISGGWQRSGRGLPPSFAVTELASWRDRIVVASSTLPAANSAKYSHE